jgi:hypothetical protein
MKKFMEVVKRQTELAAKSAAGTATKEEIAELTKLNAVVKAATEPAPAPSTKLTTMTLAAFREWHEKAVKSLEDGVADVELLAVVKRNIAAVKDQGKTLADDIVAVEMPVEKQEADKVAALEARIAELEAKAAKPAADPAPAAAPAPDPAKADDAAKANGKATDKPVSQALAMEAIDTLLAKYTKIKSLIDSGSLARKDLEELWSDYDLKRTIEQAVAIMAKADELKAMAAAVLPELEKLEKLEAPEKSGEGDAPAADGDGEAADGGEPTEKGDAPKPGSRWESGLDLAPVATAKEQAAAIKAQKSKFGF